MPLKNVHYQKLETEESDVEEDELPPSYVKLLNTNHVKGDRWNHIDNLDEFFERVYQYHQNHGLWAIMLTDIMELFQFLFIVIFSVFLVTCLRFNRLFADKITYVTNNTTNERDIVFGDLFDEKRLLHMPAILVFTLLLAVVFWLHRLYHAARRFLQFWEIRTFYHHALGVATSEMRNVTWSDILVRLKQAQREHKMNIRKQELTELDVYHRILRFQNYLVAMINKKVLPCKLHIPFYGEKIFFTHGLKFNYELLLFWGPGAPFRNSFYLHEDYKSASKKYELVSKLKFRMGMLALLNLIFSPVIFLYQILYSFFHYAEILKRHPGVFGKRRWSLYGRYHLRDLNELDHELTLRLNRAYRPSVKYMDLFTHPIVTILAQNVAFVAGSVLAVLLVMTVIQEDLLTAHNVLTFITLLGIIVTACRVFIPDENQVWIPAELMHEILGEIHYMPDHWKQRPHTVEVYREYTQVFQFTLMYIVDELLSPLVTPFILYFSLRDRAPQIVDFLRNFTIDVSGVGDVCSFAEMNVKKHGNSEWLDPGMTRAGNYEQAELGKTEISLMHFSRKNPNWRPSEDGALFMSQLKESVEEMQRSHTSAPAESLTHSPLYPNPHIQQQELVTSGPTPSAPPLSHPSPPPHNTQWSVWNVHGGHPSQLSPHHHHHHHLHTPAQVHLPIPVCRSDPLAASTLQLHQIHDYRKATQTTPHSPQSQTDPLNQQQTTPDQPHSHTATPRWSPHITLQDPRLQTQNKGLTEPLLQPSERQLVVQDTSSGNISSSSTALNMHDSTTHL